MTAVLTDVQRNQVLANIPLVEHIVNRVASGLPSTYSRDDLVQNGILGLISATLRFDPDHGVTFSAFAGRRIEGAIVDSLRRADWAPRSVRQLERRLNSVEASGVATTVQELSRKLGVDPTDLDRVRADIARARLESLDRPVDGEETQQTLSDTVTDTSDEMGDVLGNQELVGYLRRGVSMLPERHRLVIVGYFFGGKTMTELGETLGVSQSRASQIKDDALKMLRAGLVDAYPDTATPTAGRLTGRERAFGQAMAAPGPLRDRLAAGQGLSVTG
ncbi:MAG: sigma-70 family RNA polymerase sigma factor [Actinomycetota bacterium]